MNARLVFCLAMGVFTTFLGFSMLLKGCNAATRTVRPQPSNFSATSEVIEIDARTGETVRQRNITVSTTLAPPPAPESPARN